MDLLLIQSTYHTFKYHYKNYNNIILLYNTNIIFLIQFKHLYKYHNKSVINSEHTFLL